MGRSLNSKLRSRERRAHLLAADVIVLIERVDGYQRSLLFYAKLITLLRNRLKVSLHSLPGRPFLAFAAP